MALFVYIGEKTVELNPRIRTNKVVVKNLDLESCLLPKEFLSRVADKAKTLFEEGLASFAGKKVTCTLYCIVGILCYNWSVLSPL